MLIYRAIKFRIYPTKEQNDALNRHFDCTRFIYNYFLGFKTKQYKETGKSASYLAMSKELTRLKKIAEYAWLNAVSRQALQHSLANLDTAFNNFFRKQCEYPKFKSKHRSRQSFDIGFPHCDVRHAGVHLPLIGVVKCEVSALPVCYKLNSMTVSRVASGKMFVSLNIQIELENRPSTTRQTIGLDFGIKTFATTSSGDKYEHPKPFGKCSRKLAREQRRLSRRQIGSNRRRKQKQIVALVFERISNIRNDFLHKLSRKLVGENQAIYVEDLNLEGMMKRFGKSISDLGWAEFVRQLTYKGLWYGCIIEKIDRFFPSSKLCSKCGWQNQSLTLKDRDWECPVCLTMHDRDVNAAKNVLEYGRADRNLRTGRDDGISLNRETRKSEPLTTECRSFEVQ